MASSQQEHLKKMIGIQRQARHVSSEVQDYLKGLAQWTDEMKEAETKDNLERIPIWDFEDWEAGRGPLPPNKLPSSLKLRLK